VLERGAILFGKDVRADLDGVVGTNAEHSVVESSVVDGAHRDAVRNDWLATKSVFLYMGSIQKGPVAEPAECTLRSVPGKHSTSEDALVHSSTYLRQRILSSQGEVRGMG
jgi:hypothetical protein